MRDLLVLIDGSARLPSERVRSVMLTLLPPLAKAFEDAGGPYTTRYPLDQIIKEVGTWRTTR